MQNTGLVDLEVHATGLQFVDGLGHVEGNGTGLGIGHQAAGAEQTADLAHQSHDVRGGDGGVEVQPAFLDLGHQVFSTHEVGAGGGGFGLLFTLTENGHANGLAQAVRQGHSAAHHLVGVLGVNTQADGHVDGFVELGEGSAQGFAHSVFNAQAFLQVHAFESFAKIFAMLGHVFILSFYLLPHMDCSRSGSTIDQRGAARLPSSGKPVPT